MRVLMISTDRGILEENSAVRERLAEYGLLVEELHIIVFARRKKKVESGKWKVGGGDMIAENTWVYSTDSLTRWFYIHDAIALGKKILSTLYPLPSTLQWLLTCQDPFETGRVGLSLKRQFGIPLHIQIHTDFLSPYFARGSFLNKLRVRMARKILAHADGIRVASDRIKESLLKTKNYQLKTTPFVLPLFVDQKRLASVSDPVSKEFDLHKKYPQFAFIALMAARLAREKNIPLALAVLKEVAGKYERTGLVIAGDGPLQGELIREAERLGLSGNVVFGGQVPPEILAMYYKTANAFLLTSDYEGYGVVLVEAGISGCPLVTTDVGIASDFFVHKESAFICAVGDHACLARNLLWLIEDVLTRESLAARAKEALLARLYTKEEYLRLYKEMWEKCLKNQSANLKM